MEKNTIRIKILITKICMLGEIAESIRKTEDCPTIDSISAYVKKMITARLAATVLFQSLRISIYTMYEKQTVATITTKIGKPICLIGICPKFLL